MRTWTGCILAGALALVACGKGATQPPPPGAGTVNVNISCTNNLSAGVNPWSRDVERGGSVTWKLTGQGSRIDITPDSTPPWPFANAAPSGTSEASSGAMTNPPSAADTLHYTITVSCGSFRVRIDPELIIPG